MTDVHDPTKRQRVVLKQIYRSIMVRGHSPTYRDLREALGVASNNAVNDHLVALESKGMISKRPGECRGLTLTEQGCDALEYLSVQDQIEQLIVRVERLEAERAGGRV